MTVYRYTPFKSNVLGHGGEKRSYQITELLESLNLKYVNLDLYFNLGSRLMRILKFPSNYILIRTLKIPIRSIKQCWRMANLFFKANEQIKNLDPKSIIIYEHSLLLNWAIPIVLKKRGHKIIAFPHNLETLVIGNSSALSNLPNPIGLFDEISVLKAADLVLTISKEEEWLLNLFGINAKYYPYTPSVSECIDLKQIAQERSSRKANNNYLILGSVTNSPTKSGMLDLIAILNKPETAAMTFHITGFGTENLVFDTPLPNRFILHGSIDTSTLHNLYRNVDAAILHQKPSTGSLTKISELLAANIPLIANSNAARNYFNVRGVAVYRHEKELVKFLKGNLKSSIGMIIEDSDFDFIRHEILRIVQSDLTSN